jgi:signal transduction histidine kinase
MSDTLSINARVLGQLLLLESGLAAAPDETRMAEMITRGLREVPGVENAALSLTDGMRAPTPRDDPVTGDGVTRIPIATMRRQYGSLIFQVSDRTAFMPYEPFIANMTNLLAMRLENDETSRRLMTANQRLAHLASTGEPRYRSLFENMLNAYAHCRMIYDGERPVDYIHLDVNRAFETMTGLENVVGKSITEIFPRFAETNPEIIDAFGKVASTGVPEKFEAYFTPLLRWLSLSVYSPRKGEFVAVFDNITEQKNAHEKIRSLNAELERHVLERTAELEAANNELEAFSSSVSHDLRAPLRTMEGYSEALREECGASLSGSARDYLDQIAQAVKRMGELIDGFLRMARSTRGELLREEVDLSSIAVRILEELARGEPDRHVAWSVEPGVRARCDARLAEVVLSNLLGNAWKYTGRARQPSIRFAGTSYNGARAFVVSDNGTGFDMEQVPRLFKPFQRLHRGEDFPGIGIGLATVQRIVRRHGGAITAEASPGNGATFRFTLSAAADAKGG